MSAMRDFAIAVGNLSNAAGFGPDPDEDLLAKYEAEADEAFSRLLAERSH